MNKLESTIPFDGFYESFISDDIDYQIGQQIEWDTDIYDLNEDEQQVIEDSYLSVNRSYFYNQIAEDYTNFYINALNDRFKGFTLKATYKYFYSHREYNFETDRIFIEIEENHAIDFIKYIIKNYKKELVDSTLELLELNRSHCADVIDDVHFELPFYPDLLAGDYCTYVFYQL